MEIDEKFKYDFCIIGGGISGLMSAYQLRKRFTNSKICIVDKGSAIENRHCFANNGSACKHCKVCSITSGFAGAGAYSDGKYNIGTAYGGTLSDEIGKELAEKYIHLAESIIDEFTPNGTNVEVFGTDEQLKTKCVQNNLQLLDMKTKHLGTENNFVIMSGLINWLKNHNVDLFPNESVRTIADYLDKNGNLRYNVFCEKSPTMFDTSILILATGRGGSDLVRKICELYSVKTETNNVDIGVRVEMNDTIWKEFSSKIYEPKILYRTKTFEDNCRMFCFNQGGIVSAENNDGIITANGHSFVDENRKTQNCNFAILSNIGFTEPFDKPTEYVKSYSKMANIIGGGNVIVQRFGDLIRGRRTTESRLKRNSVTPTLKATPGDISLVLPYRILTNIIETVYALDKVAPGTANDDTLLYGCEAKYYSMKPVHTTDFCIYKNIFLIGDGSGIARGLSQSAAMGLYVADRIGGDRN